jgi:large subunit ribosomal protein L31e
MVKENKKTLTEVSRDYTINLHKRLHKATFKVKAPKGIKEIVAFAKKNMFTDVICFKILKNLNLNTLLKI